jgi:hypothetical protein
MATSRRPSCELAFGVLWQANSVRVVSYGAESVRVEL